MRYLLYDLETTGLEKRGPEHVVQAAMLVYDTEAHAEVAPEEMPWRAVIIDQGRFDFEPYAAAMNGWIMTEVANHRKGKETKYPVMVPKDAFSYMAGFVDQHFPRGRAVVVGKNLGAFDLAFTPEMLKKRFHYQYVELGSLFLEVGKGPKGLSAIKKSRGFNDPVTHDAIDECVDYAYLMKSKLREQGESQ